MVTPFVSSCVKPVHNPVRRGNLWKCLLGCFLWFGSHLKHTQSCVIICLNFDCSTEIAGAFCLMLPLFDLASKSRICSLQLLSIADTAADFLPILPTHTAFSLEPGCVPREQTLMNVIYLYIYLFIYCVGIWWMWSNSRNSWMRLMTQIHCYLDSELASKLNEPWWKSKSYFCQVCWWY